MVTLFKKTDTNPSNMATCHTESKNHVLCKTNIPCIILTCTYLHVEYKKVKYCIKLCSLGYHY